MQGTQETWVQSLDQEDPWRRKWQPTPVFFPGEFHGWRSLAVCSPQSHRELDTAEQLSTDTQSSGDHKSDLCFYELVCLFLKYN